MFLQTSYPPHLYFNIAGKPFSVTPRCCAARLGLLGQPSYYIILIIYGKCGSYQNRPREVLIDLIPTWRLFYANRAHDYALHLATEVPAVEAAIHEVSATEICSCTIGYRAHELLPLLLNPINRSAHFIGIKCLANLVA